MQVSFIRAKPSQLLSTQPSAPLMSTASSRSASNAPTPSAAAIGAASSRSASNAPAPASHALSLSDPVALPERDPLPPLPDATARALPASLRAQSQSPTSAVNVPGAVSLSSLPHVPTVAAASSAPLPSALLQRSASQQSGDMGSPSVGRAMGLRRTNREKQMRIPKMVLLATYKSTEESSRVVPTKGVLVDSNDSVQGVVNTLLEAFEIFTRNPEAFTLYVPAPINVWLKRTATFSAYKFVRNRMEVELREVPLESKASQTLGAGIQVQSKRRTMTVDLNRDKPMTLRLIYREKRPESPRSDIFDPLPSAGEPSGGGNNSSRRETGGGGGGYGTLQLDQLLSGASESEQAQTRVMVFRRSDTVDLILAHAAHIFKLPIGEPWALYAPPPFDAWLEEAYAIGHYTFLDSHMNLHVAPKDNNMVLKVQMGDRGEITRVLKLPPTTLVRDVCAHLTQRFPVADASDWGLIGKEKLAAVRLWLPDDQPLSAFPNVNMHFLMFRKRDDVAKVNRRESVAVKVEAKPTTCVGVSADDLDQVDDRGTQVPVCLVAIADAFVKKFGLQTEQIMSKPAEPDALRDLFRDVDAGRALDGYSVHTLVAGILHWYASLPVRIFQPLHDKLTRAATSYEASLLLAAQLPQRAGLLFAWLMQLGTDVLTNADVNQVTIEELSGTIASVLIQTDNDVIKTKLPRIMAVILRDKVDERTERQEALHGVVVESSSFDFDESDDEAPPAAVDAAAAAAPGADALLPPAPAQAAAVEKVDTWSVERVATWLRSLADQIPDAADVAANFERDQIDGPSLVMLDKADIVRLGLTKIGPQKKFFKLVDELKAQ
jgi:hypothetical protein